MNATTPRKVQIPQNYETIAWKWMRYSAILLIPLVWGHLLLQDIIVGVHRIDAEYVGMRWQDWMVQIYDIALLGFAFAHGMNGLRQVLQDFIKSKQGMRIVSIVLFVFWFLLTGMGASAIFLAAQSVLAQ